MRVVSSSPDRLVLSHTPWLAVIMVGICELALLFALSKFISRLLAGGPWLQNPEGLLVVVCSAVVFGLVLVFMLHRVRVVFDRRQRTITISRNAMFIGWQQSFPLSALLTLRVDEGRIILGFERKIADYPAAFPLMERIDRAAKRWCTSLSDNEIALRAYSDDSHDDTQARAVRVWLGWQRVAAT